MYVLFFSRLPGPSNPSNRIDCHYPLLPVLRIRLIQSMCVCQSSLFSPFTIHHSSLKGWNVTGHLQLYFSPNTQEKKLPYPAWTSISDQRFLPVDNPLQPYEFTALYCRIERDLINLVTRLKRVLSSSSRPKTRRHKNG